MAGRSTGFVCVLLFAAACGARDDPFDLDRKTVEATRDAVRAERAERLRSSVIERTKALKRIALVRTQGAVRLARSAEDLAAAKKRKAALEAAQSRASSEAERVAAQQGIVAAERQIEAFATDIGEASRQIEETESAETRIQGEVEGISARLDAALRPATDDPSRVRVFYATDRPRVVPSLGLFVTEFWFAGALLAAALFGPWLLRRILHPRLARGITVFRILAWVACLCFAGDSAVTWHRATERHERLGITYGTRLPKNGVRELELGYCDVAFPVGHTRGEIESPSWLAGDLVAGAREHVVVTTIRPLATAAFWPSLGQAMDEPERKEAFVFVHGYNNSVVSAVKRTAQIKYDLPFDGPAIAYCWASRARARHYASDEAEVERTVPNLVAFLEMLGTMFPTHTIHLIGHSMGSRILTRALRELETSRSHAWPFRELVLAAPDITADVFARMARRLAARVGRITVYANPDDAALLASSTVHDAARLGQGGFPGKGWETIDVSSVASGHSYIGDNGRVLRDFDSVMRHLAPRGRPWLERVKPRFWVMKER